MTTAEALGVNCHTLVVCHEYRQGLPSDAEGTGGYRTVDVGIGDVQDSDAVEKIVALEEQVRALDSENQARR